MFCVAALAATQTARTSLSRRDRLDWMRDPVDAGRKARTGSSIAPTCRRPPRATRNAPPDLTKTEYARSAFPPSGCGRAGNCSPVAQRPSRTNACRHRDPPQDGEHERDTEVSQTSSARTPGGRRHIDVANCARGRDPPWSVPNPLIAMIPSDGSFSIHSLERPARPPVATARIDGSAASSAGRSAAW